MAHCIVASDVSNKAGLSSEAAFWISEIAKSHVHDGAVSLDEVVKRTKKDVPGARDVDIYNALGGRVKAVVAVQESEAQKQIRELSAQAKLLAQIDDAMNGLLDTPKSTKKASKAVDTLRGSLNSLKQNITRNAKDDAQLERLYNKMNEIHDQLDAGIRKSKKTAKKEIRIDVAQAQKEYSELKRLLNTNESIADLKNQIETGKYKSPAKRELLDNPELELALAEKKRLQREAKTKIDQLRQNSFTGFLKESILSSRAMLAMADVSFILRQGLILGAGRPLKAAKANIKGVQAFFSQNTADVIDVTIRRHPNQIERQRAGLFLAELDGSRNDREELFMSNFFQSVPFLGKALTPVRKVSEMSNRSFATAMNLLRVAAFDQFVEAHPQATLEQKKAYASYVNAASGRGSLGKFENSATGLSAIFFAPRYAVSRFQAPLALLKNAKDPIVRNAIAKDWISLATTGFTVLNLAALAGASLESDPEDSDWGKIQIGETRIDIWGGLQQPMRLVAGLTVMGLKTSDVIKGKSKQSAWDIGSRFLQYKLAPTVNIPLAIVSGENVIGQEQTVSETLIRSYTPLVLQEVQEAWEETESITQAALTAAAAGTGIGVSVHSRKK